ncbi:ABC transporter substrate-binding protein [Anaeropeptidivorans aminofermentans]|uniref:ABC transporter substrate-binding protein n=1 Tax=Anaeropeptidivorans aminofermentans TaxID=2934315 RepID=UPI0020249A7D|nr:ABC transporter substrate-binding protein [Anaeropeptidivorans aminofermentans]
MKRKSINTLSMILVGLLSFGLLSGCGGNSAAAPSDASPAKTEEKSDTLVIAMENEPPNLSGAEHNSQTAAYFNDLTYSTLFRNGVDLAPHPNLVESYEAISDSEWTFTLKQGIKFHNGEELTTADVKATLDYIKTCAETEQYSKSIGSVEIVDEYTFKIYTDGPQATLLGDLAYHSAVILPKSLIESGHDFKKEPVGCGPYKFVEWIFGEKLTFEKFDDYFDKEHMPSIKNLEVRIIPEGSTRSIALETGEADFIVEVPATEIEKLRGNENIVVLENSSTMYNYLVLNTEKEPFNNPEIRRAINMAIDKEAVVMVADNGFGDISIGQAPMGMLGSTENKADTYNLEKAKEIFAAEGVDPSTIEFSIICSNDTRKRAAEVIQSNLAELGINVAVESMDLATYFSVTSEGNFTACISNWMTSDMILFLKGALFSESINGSNRARYNNPEFDALLREAMVTLDVSEREKILTSAIEVLNETTAQIPLYQNKMFRAHKKDLEGVVVSPAGTMFFEDVSWK